MLNQAAVVALVKDQLLTPYRAERERLDTIDRWYRWDHDKPHAPRTSTQEYKQLADRAQTPWLGLVVTAVAQSLYVDGYRTAQAKTNAAQWDTWQANGLDSRQVAVHRAALAYGLSFVTVLPGMASEGPMPVIRGVSPRKMQAFYADAAEDDWPIFAMRLEASGDRNMIRVYDEEAVYFLSASKLGTDVEFIEWREHGMGVCPVVRFANMLDLDGRADGEVEPLIPLSARIDQTIFDRLVVQRFASWVVRTIAGMVQPEEQAEADAKKLRLRVEDLLIADDPDTKFGSLPATPLTGFIEAKDADIRDLAAVSQTPPHHLLGQMANLSAEALAAAEASLSRKVEERKHGFGESWEQVLRLAGGTDLSAQVHWRDMGSRSLAQTADALGKLAQMLQVPVEMLWEKIPDWTQTDVERAKALRGEGDAFAQLGSLLNGQAAAPVA